MKTVMVILPPTLQGPGMIKSPPLDIASLVGVLRAEDQYNVVLADFRKNIPDDASFYKDRGVDLALFEDFRKCLRHCVREDADISRTVAAILAGLSFDGVHGVVLSVAAMEQFAVPYLMAALCLASFIKKEHPGIQIVLFGSAPTAHVSKIMKLFQFIDAFPTGGNEFAVLDHLKGRAAGPVDGLYYRAGKVVVAPRQARAMDLDRWPVPDFSLFDLKKYRSADKLVLPYEMSRGCANSCFYCYYIHKGSVHKKDPAKIVAELKALSRQYRTRRFHLMDAAINADADWLMRVCDLLKKDKAGIIWSALAVPDMSRPLLDKLQKAGCVQLRWGVESGSERLLKTFNKDIRKGSMKDTLAYAHSIGINNYITLISGLDRETEEDVTATKDFIEEIAPWIDSAQECVYGELGHFYLSVFEPASGVQPRRRRVPRYDQLFRRLGIGQQDIIHFMAQVNVPAGRG